MPKTKLTDERAMAIAQNYCSNGFNKTEGLRAIRNSEGKQFYSNSYCESLGHLIYSNIKVKTEIDRILAEKEQIVDVKVARIITKLVELAFGEVSEQSQLRALELLGRYKDIWGTKADQAGLIINIKERETEPKSVPIGFPLRAKDIA